MAQLIKRAEMITKAEMKVQKKVMVQTTTKVEMKMKMKEQRLVMVTAKDLLDPMWERLMELLKSMAQTTAMAKAEMKVQVQVQVQKKLMVQKTTRAEMKDKGMAHWRAAIIAVSSGSPPAKHSALKTVVQMAASSAQEMAATSSTQTKVDCLALPTTEQMVGSSKIPY
jgi:hypothetical protein